MQPQTSYGQPDDYDALLALLRMVGDDVYSLAYDITSLGESLSMDHAVTPETKLIQDLQSFDSISQRALAQARLIHGIARILAGCVSDWNARVDALIQSMPFDTDRQRLSAAFRGQQLDEPNPKTNSGNDLDLF